MRITFHGVRGSTPACGADFLRYGGHTSCVALAHDGRPPTLVLDAGTGIRRLTAELAGAAFRGSILLTHLHWDHTQGLPFFAAGDRADAQVTLLMPAQGEAADVLSKALSPPHFPITPTQLRGRWRFEGIEPGAYTVEGFDVTAVEIPHKGGRTYGYRVSAGGATIAYLPDHCPTAFGAGARGFGVCHEAALTLAADADVLINDAQYTAAELPARLDWGHCAADYAADLAQTARVGTLLLFHHEPNRVDEAVDEMVAAQRRQGLSVAGAAEGMVVDLPLVAAVGA